MNSTLSISRHCARQCSHTRPRAPQTPVQTLQQQYQPATKSRSISSTPSHLYAQHTDLPTEQQTHAQSQSQSKPSSAVEAEAFTHTQSALQPTTSTHRQSLPSRHPELQNQPPPSHMYTGKITRTGTMPQTVQITRHHQVLNKLLQKHYTRPLRLKAHDPHPAGYLREGDIVEYGAYTQAEKDTKQALDIARVERETARLEETDRSGKAVRKFKRSESTKKKMRGHKVRGVQFVVRRVVTPFGVGLDERMERLGEGMGQERSAKGGQDSLLKGAGGSISRATARASVAG